jgi:type I restriction enzyme S subunit
MGQSPPSSTYNKEGIGLPFLQGKMEFGEVHPSPVMYCSNPMKVAEANDILISVRAPVGDANLAPWKLCIGRGLAAIRPNSRISDHLFYFYYLQRIKRFLEALGKGSTFKAIVKNDLESLIVPLPPLPEQKAIAQILSTVDEAIQKTNEVIAKTERLKKGLMQELLTKGIGHEEFKDTEIGRIPKEWKVVRIKDVVERTTDIISVEKLKRDPERKRVLYSIPAYHDKGRPELVKADKIGSIKFFVRAGDVLFGKINPKVPKIWIVEHDNALASTEFIVLRPNVRKSVSRFIYYLLQTNRILQLSIALAKGAVPSRLRTDIRSFMRIQIPLPSLPEQQKIAEILLTVDKRLEVERKRKEKLERIKKALMDLLLTGKIRVKVS